MEKGRMIKKYFWRVFISFIGLVLILYPLFNISIGLVGQDTIGTITSYQRILGERDEVIPNRYTYSLGYKFYVNEVEYHNSTTVINSPLFIKPDGKSLIEIRYIKEFPKFNTLKSDTYIDIGKLMMIILGVFLIYVMNPKKK